MFFTMKTVPESLPDKRCLKPLKCQKKSAPTITKAGTWQTCQDYSTECIYIGKKCQTIAFEYASSVNANCSTVDTVVTGGTLSIAPDHFCLLRTIITQYKKNDND